MRYYNKLTHTETDVPSETTILETDERVIKFFKPLGSGEAIIYGDDDLPYFYNISANFKKPIIVNGIVVEGKTQAEIEAEALAQIMAMEVSMAQFRAALITSGMKDTVDEAVANSGNALLISDYEYRATVKRDWGDLVTMAATIGITDEQINEVFILAQTL